MNVATILHDQALRRGDQPAIIEAGRTISFSELDRAAGIATAELARAGLVPGMRALVFSPMSIDLYIAMIGMFRLRVTAVFVDPSAGLDHLAACVARVRPDAFIAVPRAHLLRLTSAALRSIPIKMTLRRLLSRAGAGSPPPSGTAPQLDACDADTPAIITFTSGATGAPKAAVRTHGLLLAQHRALAASLALEPGAADLTTLPIVLLANLASGVTSIIPDADLRAPGAIRPEPVLDQIRDLQPTRIVGTPALLERLIACAARRGERFDGLRRIYTGGAPVFPGMLDIVASVAPAASVVAVYGSTEAEPIAAIDRCEIAAEDRLAMQHGAGLLAGQPAASIDVRILPDRWGTPVTMPNREDIDRQALGPTGVGEIVVSGEHVVGGYLDGAGDLETKIHAGDRIWHRTGDAGYFDRRGRLWLLGRCAARVSDDDGILYPFAVECAASDVPGLRRSAFVRYGGRRLLVIEVEEQAVDVRDALIRRLTWAHLDDVLIVERVPVDHRHNAKIDYPALEELLATQIIDDRQGHRAWSKIDSPCQDIDIDSPSPFSSSSRRSARH
jgi:acyl-CoA synthetase (AMP-forming)/AMP-acid ligase II